MAAYTNVLVGTDGSETAERAVEHAARLATACGAELTIISAYASSPGSRADVAGVPQDMQWRVTDAGEAEGKLRHGRHAAHEIGVEVIHTRVVEGDPADAIVDTAKDVGADLVVMGSKGMTSASRFVLGSVPNKVSHHAPCDVLIVHTV